MTNGEKMQEIFPEGKTRKCRDGVVFESDGWCHAYDSDWWNTEHKEPTTKNDSEVEEHKGEVMDFPNTFDEFADDYGFKDTKEVYTNGSELIQVYRVKQWLEHINEKTTMIDKSNFSQEQYKADLQSAYDCGYNQACKSKITMPYATPDNCGNYIEQTPMSDLEADCIDRTELLKAMDTWPKFGVDRFGYMHTLTKDNRNDLIPYIHYGDVIICIKGLPSVTPQELRRGHWIPSKDYEGYQVWRCSLCRSETYDNTNYCPHCGAEIRKKMR